MLIRWIEKPKIITIPILKGGVGQSITAIILINLFVIKA